MRVALVSPYSWSYPGGVTRHIEALARELDQQGHEVRVFAPFDADDRKAALLHRGGRPQARAVPAYLTPLGSTVGLGFNGAMSNVALTPHAVSTLRIEIGAYDPDVVHLHEPPAAIIGWDTLVSTAAPVVATFHCYSEKRLPHAVGALVGIRRKLNRVTKRIAVSEAAAWTGRRFWGGDYAIVPNGVDLPADGVPAPRERAAGDPLRIVFVGQAVERKGLPVLLRAFEALRAEVPATLTVIGASEDEIAPILVDATGVTALGRVSDEDKHAALAAADVLCAPSLGGESFGMVLTEAFAAGAPVVASDIAGYRGVVTHGHDGLLVPRGDATALAETLRELALDPAQGTLMGTAAAQTAERYAWPRVAEEIHRVYEQAVAAPRSASAVARAKERFGLVPAGGAPRRPARRIPSLEVLTREETGRRRAGLARKGVLGIAALAAAGLALLGLQRIGLEPIGSALLSSSPSWVLLALALMCSSMVLRAVCWHSILKAALPLSRPRFADAMQGTSIGVLMSATLPARLGEPSRALIVARRLGHPRERLPVVLGTIVSQALLNVLALVILGAVMFSTVGLFAGRQQALVFYAIAPLVVLFVVLLAPALLRSGLPSRSARVHRWLSQARAGATRVRDGLRVFRSPKLSATAVFFQLGAWGVQWLSCYVLLVALGLDERAGIGAAAAVLFAVNITAVLPVTPSNLGVFQAACVAVLTGAYGVSAADALGYGIILQAVEITTAVIMGAPALVKEGTSWREVRLRALHHAPVALSPRGRAVEDVA